MPFREVKSAFKSKGFWGGILALIPAVDLVQQVVAEVPAAILPIEVSAGLGIIGSLLAILGRFAAKSKITIP
jgi:hypothetical protein